jgi:hypothetical protein
MVPSDADVTCTAQHMIYGFCLRILNFNLNFFSISKVLQSTKSKAQISSIPNTVKPMLFHEVIVSLISPRFDATIFPVSTIMASLMNFPIRNGGMIAIGLTRATPAAVKIGVLGKGINV